LILDEFLKLLLIVMLLTAGALSTDIGSLSVYYILKVDAGFLLEVVDI
jgi:hypothetical protein